ncbi:MAG TPA: hypothetical protein VD997_08595 [Phycisphaerales bacterium]|nr:hypothetical protein [Phycisphaerales bacterium]
MQTPAAAGRPSNPAPKRRRLPWLAALAAALTLVVGTAIVFARREVALLGFSPGVFRTASSTQVEQIAPGPNAYAATLPLRPGETLFATLRYTRADRAWPVPREDPPRFGDRLPVGTLHSLTVSYFAAGGAEGKRDITEAELPRGLRQWLAGVLEGRTPPATTVAGLLRDSDGRRTEWAADGVLRVLAIWLSAYWWAAAAALLALDAAVVARVLRARRRRSQGRCACGYDRRGLAADAHCPECGLAP